MENVMMINKKTIEENYSIIEKEGTIRVKAGSHSPYFNEKLGKDTYIVNLKAIDIKNKAKIIELFKGKEEIDVKELNGLTMSFNIIVNDGKTPNVPMKGQEVSVTIGKVKTKNAEEVLAVVSYVVPTPATAKKFSFDDLKPETKKEASNVKIGEEAKTKETVKA